MTASVDTLQNKAIFSLSSWLIEVTLRRGYRAGYQSPLTDPRNVESVLFLVHQQPSGMGLKSREIKAILFSHVNGKLTDSFKEG